MTQRNGRIIRQGNRNPIVQVYNYVTEGTFDSYLWQTLENKQKFISQIMTSKSPVRSCEDVDEQVLTYAEVKSLVCSDDRIKRENGFGSGYCKIADAEGGASIDAVSVRRSAAQDIPGTNPGKKKESFKSWMRT